LTLTLVDDLLVHRLAGYELVPLALGGRIPLAWPDIRYAGGRRGEPRAPPCGLTAATRS
jgi:hypothetical protein